jgi:hypothetical protein
MFSVKHAFWAKKKFFSILCKVLAELEETVEHRASL